MDTEKTYTRSEGVLNLQIVCACYNLCNTCTVADNNLCMRGQIIVIGVEIITLSYYNLFIFKDKTFSYNWTEYFKQSLRIFQPQPRSNNSKWKFFVSVEVGESILFSSFQTKIAALIIIIKEIFLTSENNLTLKTLHNIIKYYFLYPMLCK